MMQVWDSGFISIPYNFKMGEFPTMLRMLKSGGEQQQPSVVTPTAAEAHNAVFNSGRQHTRAVAMASTLARSSNARRLVYQRQQLLSGPLLQRPPCMRLAIPPKAYVLGARRCDGGKQVVGASAGLRHPLA